ncbi:MAG: energy-coupling factor transporter transmembrane protein EcfT, partial [Synergistaceae bacterium]|nr:energy-coupling factor transporter transmembrane protein EcfT [Synergistaceae bacterium]
MAFTSVAMGQYVPLNSPVHRLDPRAKLFLLIAIMCGVFPSNDPLSLSFSALALLGTVKLSRIPAGTLLRSCR